MNEFHSDELNQTKGNILVVDDTPVNLKILTHLLGQRGYTVRQALNGKMAITACEATAPDLILLDINMPDMDGYQVCEYLKQNSSLSEIPVIFLSALDDVLDKVKAFDVGGADYITKPFQALELFSRIENQLKLRSLQMQVHKKNMLLQQAVEELKQAQAQLVQKEKMVSLAQMVAGIAHEINNPVNFIYGNLSHISEYTEDLLKLLQLYQKAMPKPPANIEDLQGDIDWEFISEDLHRMVGSMKAGADRIREIVLSLRSFSRLGEAELKAVDIHEGIDSSLMLLQHRLQGQSQRPDITVIRAYGDLPKVNCSAAEINQVFLNILTNAIDALETPSADEVSNPKITITTSLADGQRVAIAIADNGHGMTETVKNRIFDPFFTTKKVGSGKGLGLSISYQIVADHGGRLSCDSHPEKGSTFTVILPVQHQTKLFDDLVPHQISRIVS
ncbi:MAG TPA: response regulator [Oscillatoriaceae cyanobacterium M33_DOE_052]|uniref:histidine kinase n=1 Tax=Planktothricoides sp. SpSt-374 TaxID=2282167 RepID=A0A7C3ZTK3_9CYAN|nr:response regulator [Oscillatoriaceae cyanobacterium M33_DOE_052]